jgi:hypothetical protein
MFEVAHFLFGCQEFCKRAQSFLNDSCVLVEVWDLVEGSGLQARPATDDAGIGFAAAAEDF